MELSTRTPDSSTLEANPVTIRETPPAENRLGLKLFAAAFSFFAAGANDGCMGSLIPYILGSYGIGTRSIAILYVYSRA